jgi:predicted dehydrogenase
MRVLIIGLGSIAKKHIAALKEIDTSVELFALRSSDASEEVIGIRSVYSLNEIKDLVIDFIVISNPTFKHRETIEGLLKTNLPLFIEKPLFDKLEAEDLIQTISEKNLVTYIACNLRFLECLHFAKAFIADKRINEVNIYCGSYLPEWRPGQNFRGGYSANCEMGGGVHIDLIHEIDYAYWMFGKPNDFRRTISAASSLEITAADYANYLLQYDQFSINVILNYYRRDAKRTLEVVCEDGTINVNLLKGEVYWNENLVLNSTKMISDTYLDQMRFFTENILTGKESLNTVHEAYEILKICLAD